MMTRRAATKAAALTALSYSRILGANDRIALGAIGLGVRGSYVMSLFQKNADVEVRALCDPRLPAFLAAAGIQLCSFRSLPEAVRGSS